MKKGKMPEHIITMVEEDSIAMEMEIEPGDVLLAINDQPIKDVFDYRYYIKDEYIEVLIRKADGEEWLLEIDKEYDDDLGLEFENSLMSDYRSCSNKCIFCFIDQMPPGMRETLYFKDDDSRLSFLQGNYITLTNMNDDDVERIVKMQLAPINISVHTTNPELRCRMLHNRFAGQKLDYIRKLYENRVEMNGQVVLCKGYNDGAELDRTIRDLSAYLPFMRSVSVVPAGITKYRDNLPKLTLFSKEEAERVIDQIEAYQSKFYDEYGLHFIHASDEWYILAGREFPEEERYDGYIQLENGVGMMRLFKEEFKNALCRAIKECDEKQKEVIGKRNFLIATGKLTYPTMLASAKQLMDAFPGLYIRVLQIRNDFFGETITVSGLITGQDLIAQIKQLQEEEENCPRTILIPSNMLRSGEEVFLDDLTITDLERELSSQLIVTEESGEALVDAIMDVNYKMLRKNDENSFVYIQAHGIIE